MAKSQKTIEKMFKGLDCYEFFMIYPDDAKPLYCFELGYASNNPYQADKCVQVKLYYQKDLYFPAEEDAKKYLKGHDLTMNNLLAVLMRKYTEYWRNKE